MLHRLCVNDSSNLPVLPCYWDYTEHVEVQYAMQFVKNTEILWFHFSSGVVCPQKYLKELNQLTP